jgi:hypothetical protein
MRVAEARVGWFLLSMLISPLIALLLVLVMQRTQQTNEPTAARPYPPPLSRTPGLREDKASKLEPHPWSTPGRGSFR